jgi:hypothetical protein
VLQVSWIANVMRLQKVPIHVSGQTAGLPGTMLNQRTDS